MKGVVFPGNRKLEIMDFQDPTRVREKWFWKSKVRNVRKRSQILPCRRRSFLTGIGKLDGPIIVGHEPCGVVAAVGEGVPQEVAWEECGSCNIIIEAAGIANIAQLAGCNSASMA